MPEASNARATAIILVLLDIGTRLTELLDLRLANLDLELGRAKILWKGAKERYVYFGKSTKRALWRYISLPCPRPKLGKDNVFLSEDGRQITTRYLTRILNKVSKAAGVSKVHPIVSGERLQSSFCGTEETYLLYKNYLGTKH